MLGDGVTHINVYGQSVVPLGRLLSNFAHTPFTWEGLSFASVEAWWYWMRLGKDDPVLRALHGFEAKKYGRGISGIAPSYERLKQVYHAKLEANQKIGEMLRASVLPFDHYYVYDGKRIETRWRWTGQLWNEIREEINRG